MLESNSQDKDLLQLPFVNLTDPEFRAVTASWHFDLSDRNLDIYDVIPNPDKFDERDPDAMLNIPCSHYFSLNKLNSMLNTGKCSSKSISLYHCNIRSLQKNLGLLEDFIYSLEVKPDILALSETRINSKTIVITDIPGYNFFHTDSMTAAGGVGLYTSYNLQALHRRDIVFTMPLVESCWCEISSNDKNKPNIIIGCIYKHPNASLSDFTSEMEHYLEH